MALTIDDQQLTLAQRSDIGLFPLVVLETFTDRDARTVDSTYYWTRGAPFFYEWDGATAVQFEPILLSVSPISRGFNHIPDQGDYSIREGLELELDASPRAGDYLWQTLIGERLIGARVTVASLLVDVETAEDDPRWFDLEALGQVHTVRWRGEVTAMPEFSDDGQTFRLICDTEDQILEGGRKVPMLPRIPAEEHGRNYPFLVGDVDNVKPIWFDAGFGVTTSASFLSTGNISVFMTAEQVAAVHVIGNWGSFGGAAAFGCFVLIGSEIARMTSLTGSGPTYSLGVAGPSNRGAFGSTAQSGDVGTVVYIFGKELRFGVSGGAISGLGTSAYYTAAGGGEVDLLALIPLACRAANISGDSQDPAGVVGCFVIDNLVCLEAYGNFRDHILQLVGLPNDTLRVDVKGGFSIAESGTAILTIDGDETNWSHFARTSQPDPPDTASSSGSIDAITGGISCTGTTSSYERRYHRDSLALTIGLCEIEWTFTIPANDWDDFRSITFYVNYSASWAYEEGNIFYKQDLASGENTIRILSTAATIDDIGLIVIFDRDGSPADERIDIVDDPTYYLGTAISAGSHPADVLEYVLDNLLPSAAITANAASFTQVKTDVPSVSVNTDISAVASTLAELVAAIGFNSRTNAVLSEGASGTELKLLAAETDYDFGASIRALGANFTELKMSLRNITEIGNRFSAVYDAVIGQNLDRTENYREQLTADEVTNDISAKISTGDITTGQTEYGQRRAEPLPFIMLTDSTSAIDVLGYYVNESLRGQVAKYSCLVAFDLGFDLEAGDIVTIQPRWESSVVKTRVLRTVFSFDEHGVGLVLEEVT